MTPIDRKDAIRHYKDHPPPRGVFAVRSAASGQVWVGASKNLDAARNSLLFSLRQGLHRDRALQADWHEHSDGRLRFEVLETLPDDVTELTAGDELKARLRAWAAELGATILLP